MAIKRIASQENEIEFIHDNGDKDSYTRENSDASTWTFEPANGDEIQTLSNHEVGSALVSALSNLHGMTLSMSAAQPQAEEQHQPAPGQYV